jgi:hypothetical protein
MRTNEEIKAILDSTPETDGGILQGLDAIAELIPRLGEALRNPDLTDDERTELVQAVAQLRQAVKPQLRQTVKRPFGVGGGPAW